MEEKVKTGMTSVCIDAPTFQRVVFHPALVNFFYGRNGSGKSTVAKALYGKSGITWEPGFDSDVPVCLYNEEYIQKNISSYAGMDGVFTISEANAEILEQISQLGQRRAEKEEEYHKLCYDESAAQRAVDEENDQHEKALWRSTAEFRKEYPAVIAPGLMKNISKFVAVLKGYEPVIAEKTVIQSQYGLAFGENHPSYECYDSLPETLPPEIDLLDIPIVSGNDTEFAAFCKRIGSLDWLRMGHEKFQHQVDGCCPYCQQQLPENFEQSLAACFDTQYQEDKEQLEEQIKEYREYTSFLTKTLKKNIENPFPGIQVSKYRRTAELLLSKLREREQIIENKLVNMSHEYTFDSINELLNELFNLTEAINAKIKAYMQAISDLPAQQADCVRLIWSHMAYITASEQERHAGKVENLNDQKKTLEKRKSDVELEIKRIDEAIVGLNQKTVNTTVAMNAINRMLAANGFCGFQLREKPGEHYRYQLVRKTVDDAVVASGLSEGERHLIAFLYFYHEVMGSRKADGTMENKIVVIDDPVSSMDSGTLNIVAALTREMIAVCRDNARRLASPVPGHIKQIFCLTHNPVYFRTVSTGCLADYENCSFFEIRKDRQNHSDIILCEEEIADFGRRLVNKTPITNDYEYLWREFFRTSDPVTLMNVCRRILAAYFLQTVGHPADKLSDRLLDENQSKFVRNNDDGSPDRVLYNIAHNMICMMEVGTNGVLDSMYYDATAYDTDQLRYVFRMIFDIMDSSQHYLYMQKQLA